MRPRGIISGSPGQGFSGSPDQQPEGAAGAAGGADRDAQAGLAADRVVELTVEVEAVSRGAQHAMPQARQPEQVAAAGWRAGSHADRAVERRGERLDRDGAPAPRHAPADRESGAVGPRIERVFANRLKGAGVGFQKAGPLPPDGGFREPVAGEGLGEGLAGVLVVVDPLVAREEAARPPPLADVLVARPAGRPPVDRRREGRRGPAVLGDVVPVLVGEDEVTGRSVGTGRRR
jgi:hypothetical protein